jgi:hypothetical protein
VSINKAQENRNKKVKVEKILLFICSGASFGQI